MLKNLKIKKNKKAVLKISPLGLLFLSACGGGGGGGNEGIIGGASQSFSGFVVKGPLSKATVFADYDGDGVQDSNEPSVLTGSDGSYSLTAGSNFSSIVVTTNDQTIDTFTGAVLDGVTLKAPKDATVVSPTSTMVVESNLTVSEVAAVLGLPEGFNLDFNPFEENADPTMAAAVEKTSQMVMTTITAISSTGEGAGLSKNDAFKTAMDAIVSVVKSKVETNNTVDFANASTLEEIQSKASEVAVTKGIDESAFNIAIDAAIEKTKTANNDIKNIDDSEVFSEASKTVFSSATNIAAETKSFAETLNTAFSTTPTETTVVNLLSITTVANDDIINATEKVEGFYVSGKSSPGSEVEVEIAEGLKKTVTSDKNTGEWSADFRSLALNGTEKSILTNLNYPLTVKAQSEGIGGIKFKDEKKVELNENLPTLTINALGGSDGIVNIPEWTSGLTISGNTNAETGSVLKISLTDTSGNILSGFENIAGQVNGGIWSATMPTNSRPSGDFKVKAEITNQAGNSKTVTSSNITTDFVPANVSGISDNVSGIATGNITYTITFDSAVSYLNSNTSAFTVNNGTVSSVTGSGQNYSVVVTPDNNKEGNVELSINTSGGAKDSSLNDLAVLANSLSGVSGNKYIQAFDTKGPSVSSITVPVSTVQSAANITVTLSEAVTTSQFTTADLSVSSGSIGTLVPQNVTNGKASVYLVPYTPSTSPAVDGNVTLTVASGGYQDAVGNSGSSSSKVFAVDTKGPSGVLSLPTGSFSLGEKLNFSLTYDEAVTVPISAEDPFLVLTIDDRVRMATKEASSDNSVLKFSYTVANSDFDNNGIGISLTTGLSKGVFQLSGTFSAGDKIKVTNSGNKSGEFTVESGATSVSAVATQLRKFLNSDSTFASTNNLKAVGLGSGKIAVVGNDANSSDLSITSSNGSSSKVNSESYSAIIRDAHGNNASATFSLGGDPTGITVDGGASGKGVDGYIEGVSIYSDNDGDGSLSFGDSTASTNPTGVFKLYGASGPMIMSGGTDKATGLPFGVQYEAPSGYTIINPISSIIRSLETKDSSNTGQQITTVAENKVASALGVSNVDFKNFDAYSAVSTVSQIPNAIEYQKSAAAVALVVDIGSTGFVELVKQIEASGGNVPEAYKISGKQNPFTTQKASELMFDALADAVNNGTIGAGKLKSFGSDTGTVDDMAQKLVNIITPTAQTVLGSNYDNYKNALVNESLVLAAGVHRVENKPFASDAFPTTTEAAIDALTKIIQTQSVWQGDANQALEDNSTDNDWLSFSDTLPNNVTFTPVDVDGKPIAKDASGYANIANGGYLLQINGAAVDPSVHSVKWYQVTFRDGNTDQISSSALNSAPPMNKVEVNGTNTVFGADVLRIAAGGSQSDSPDVLKTKGLTFEIKLVSDDSVIISKENAPVVRADTFFLNENLADNIFTWGGLADGATVGVVVPTSYDISANPNDRDKFEGNADGSGAEFNFTVTRQGNMSQTQKIDYEVQTSKTLTAEDFEGSVIPSGTIVFAPDETSKTLTINIKNDTIKETDESFNVRLKDELGTAQILQDVVSFAILDDDPSNPELTLESTQSLAVSAGDSNNNSLINFDYFDPTTTFNLTSLASGGLVTFDGNVINATDKMTFTQVKSALSKISFKGDSGKNSGSILVTVTDSERGNSGEATLNYQIQNQPEVRLSSAQGQNFTSGLFGSMSGTTVNDIDFIDLNSNGIKDINEQSQTILMTISSQGGKISLVDPNETANNSIEVVVDVSEDERGANILGKSGAVNSVLSSLRFKGDPNQSTASITFSASDGDDLTPDTVEVLNLTDIQSAPPSISVPNNKINVKAEKEALLPGISVSDIDSPEITLEISAPSGIFKGINTTLYNVQGLDTNKISIAGSPSAINVALEDLKYVGVQGSGNLQITVDAKDQTKTAKEKSLLNITVVDNEPPSPGGDLVFKNGSNISQNALIDEDTTSNPTVTFNIAASKLINPDGDRPTDIRILSVKGGVLKLGGNNVEIGDSASKISLEEVKTSGVVTSYKKDFTFTPDADRTDSAIIEYAIVDPVLDTANSLPSKATIPINPVNDKPELLADSAKRVFTEGDLGLVLDRSISIKDKDSTKLSEAKLILSNKQSGDTLIYSDAFWDAVEDSTAKTLTLTSKSSEFGKALSIFEQALRSVKFSNSEDNPNTIETRKVTISVKDAAPSATNSSDSSNKTSSSSTFDINVLGTNDIPSFSTAQNSLTYQEGSGASSILGSATITDGDVSSLANLVPKKSIVKISSGFVSGEDKLSIPSSYSAPTGLTASFSSEGDLTIKNNSSGETVLASTYNAGSGELIINNTGNSFNMSHLKSLLETIVYTNSSDSPVLDPRKISVVVSDDKDALSNEFFKTINLNPINDNPTLDLDGSSGPAKIGQDGPSTSYVGRVHKNAGVKIVPKAEFSDLDSDFLSTLTVSLTNGIADNGSSISDQLSILQQGLNIIKANNLTLTKEAISGVSDAKITVSGSAKIDQYQEILQNIIFKSAETPNSSNRTITIEASDVDREGGTAKTIQKLDYTDPNNIQVISGQKQSVTVKISDNPIALVSSGSKTLALSISDNPSSFTWMEVDLNIDHVALNRAKVDVPSNLGDPLRTALNVDASSVTASNIGVDIIGTPEENTITGSPQSDLISGGAGKDTIDAGGGSDTVDYSSQATKIIGGSGTDFLRIIGKNDVIIDLSEADSGDNQIKILDQQQNFQNDTGAIVSEFEDVDASQSSGSITIIGKDGINMNTLGGSGSDNITGGSGNDVIKGKKGADTIKGGLGNDTLYGNRGADILYGGKGTDQLYGGLGSDTYVFLSSDLENDVTDVIHDLQKNEKIGLSTGVNWRKINETDVTSEPTWTNKDTAGDTTLDAYIQQVGGSYKLVIEKVADGSEKAYVSLGSDRPFEPLKWVIESEESGIQYLKIEDNNAPALEVSKSNISVPISGAPSGQLTSFGTIGSVNQPFISVSDSDGDKVFVTLSATGGSLSKSSIGGSSASERLSVSEANNQLQNLSFTGDTRGDASITVTVSDGFESKSDTIFLTVPNTAPVLSSPTINLTSKIGGVPFSLSNIGFSDPDSLDRGPEAIMSISINASSGIFETQLPTLIDTGQTFDHDADGGSVTAEIPVYTFKDNNENIFLTNQNSIVNVLDPKEVFALDTSSFGGNIISSSGNFIIAGNEVSGYIIEPVIKKSSTSSITHDFELTSQDDDIIVSSNTSNKLISNFLANSNGLKATGNIYEITEGIVSANSGLPLSAGNFALIGDNVDGWKLHPLNISNPNNITAEGSAVSLSSSQKTAFDNLSLSSSATFTLDSVPFNAGYSYANFSLIGLGSSSLELKGDLSSIDEGLQIVGLNGSEAGMAQVFLNGRDTLGASAEPKTFNVTFQIGDPAKPSLPSNIQTGVSVDELSAGFPVSVSIDGTGVKAGDTVKLVSSLNGGSFETVEEVTLLDSDINLGVLDFLIDPLSFPSTKQIFETTGNNFFTPSQLKTLEGSYVFQAIINNSGQSLESDPVNLDFTGPTVPSIALAVNDNSVNTDNGLFNNDNISSIVRPKINLTNESGLNSSDIILDISDGKGSSQFNKGTFANVFSVGNEQPISVDGQATGQSIYPLTFSSIDLPDNDYGFYLVDSSGNKSIEASKIIFVSVDEYGHQTSNAEDVAGYLLSLTSGLEFKAIGNTNEPIEVTPNATLNGSDYYLFTPFKIGANDLTPSSGHFFDFKITLPNGQKISHSDLGINFTYGSKEIINYNSEGWFTIDTHKPHNALGNSKELTSDQKTAFDALNITAESYNYKQSSNYDPAPVYIVSAEKATEFANAVSDTSILSSGGSFALLSNSDGSFSLQEITTGKITLTEFEDKGRSSSDFFSNDTTFVLNIENREPFTAVELQKKIDSGNFEVTTKNQDLTLIGTQNITYKAKLTDLAGNFVETGELVVKLETDTPTFAVPISLGNDDKGTSSTDLLTYIQTPTFTFTSEPGLRVFITKEEDTMDLPSQLQTTYTEVDATSGVYSATISENLEDGTYQITIEDDAGNHTAPTSSEKIKIDATPPVFSSVTLIGGTDKGVNTNDRYTAVKKPVLTFNSEPDLTVYIEYDNGSETLTYDSTTGETPIFNVNGGKPFSYRIDNIFGTDTEGNSIMSFEVRDIFGTVISPDELLTKGLSLKNEYSSDGSAFSDANPTHLQDGSITIGLNEGIEGTPELDGVTHVKTKLVDANNSVVSEKVFLKSPAENYKITANLNQDLKSLDVSVINIDRNSVLRSDEFSSLNFEINTLVSLDNGVTFITPSLSISDLFPHITHVKYELENKTDPDNPVVLTELIESIPSIYSSMPGKYVINFNSNLNDGSYKVLVMDNAGNLVPGLENQIFNIDTTVPSFTGPIDLGATDLGRFKQNILYTSQDETDGNIPVGKAVGDVKILTDRLTNNTSPEIKFQAEAGLRTFISYDDLKGNIMILPDPFADPNSPGFNPPIYSQTFSSGTYTLAFNSGIVLGDGEYTVIIEDDAGNRITGGSEQKYTIETIKPELSPAELVNNTDTGISSTDRTTNNARPEINLTSEGGLRIFLQRIENDQTISLLPKNGIDPNPVYSVVEPNLAAGDSAQYSISFSSDLSDGTYKIIAEDDAGNENELGEHIFEIDRTLPVLSGIGLGETDAGKSNSDLLTNVKRPNVEFESEVDLSVFVENISASTNLTEKVGDATGDYTVTINFVDFTTRKYIVNFESDLNSGDYRIYVKDVAGNQNTEGLGLDVYRVDVDSPTFSTPIRLGSTDVGRNINDKLTNIKRPEIKFNAEEGLNVGVLYHSDPLGNPSLLNAGSFNVIASNSIKLTGTQKGILETLPEVGTFDLFPTSDIFTITSTHVSNNSNLGLSAGSYILSGNASNGWKVQPVDISVLTSVVTSGVTQSITSEQKTIWDSLSLTSVGTYDPKPPANIYTITSTHVTDNSNLGITAGSYILSGNSTDGFQVQPVNISDLSSIVTNGAAISITTEQKTIWDSLSLVPLSEKYDAFPSVKVFTVSKAIATTNSNLGLSEGSYALSGNTTDGWAVEILDHIILKVTESGGKYLINGVEQGALQLTEGKTYVFDWSSASTHPLKFSTTIDGTHTSGGIAYTQGITLDALNSTTTFNVLPGTPDLFYYCDSHASMGSSITTLSQSNPNIIEYTVSFNNDLGDGDYVISITDDAGNEVIGSNDQLFKIETVVPEISTLVLAEGLDTGISNSDRATTVLKPNFSFNSEAGLRVFIDRTMDPSYTGLVTNGMLTEDTDYSVTDNNGSYEVVFLSDFPNDTQGSYTISVEDDAGNKNIVNSGSSEHIIRVDNLKPILLSQKIDSTGRFLELTFNEELDLNPDSSDISLTLVSGNGSTNTITLTAAEINITADKKSIVKYSFDFPVFSGDTYEMAFTSPSLSKFKDLVGKTFDDPGTLSVTNDSSIHRSAGKVADGYIAGAKVFHDLNENGVFDPATEVFVNTQNDGSFSGLHGDVGKPLVAIGGTDTSTGLPFQSKTSAGVITDISLYSASGATIINPLTSLVFQMVKQVQPQNHLKLDFNSVNSSFSAQLNGSSVDTATYDTKFIFSNGSNDVSEFILSGNTITETEFNAKIAELFGGISNAFDGVRVALFDKGTTNLVVETSTFNSIDSAKTTSPSSAGFTSVEASSLLIDAFSKLTALSDVYNYDPIANNDINTQALSSQIANLMIAAPYVLNSLNNSNQVLELLVNKVMSFQPGDAAIDLGSQTDLETLFGVDNTPPAEGEPAPDILRDLALANQSVGNAASIELQTFGLISARDELIENRILRDISSLETNFQATEDGEKFIGSVGDDIIFGAGGDDLFGGGTAVNSINEGDIFIGGSGKDTAVFAGKEDDYIFMVEDPGSAIYNAIETALNQGSLNNEKLLLIQKATNPTGYTYVQSEVIRFTADGTWVNFDQSTGEISGSMMSEVITGSSLKTDLIKGGSGNDTLSGFGGHLSENDLIDGGFGNDIIIAAGNNTKATGGSGQDIFKISGLNGSLLITDFSSTDDKIDLRDFKSSGAALTIEDIITASSDHSEGAISGVKIDLSSWTNGTDTFTGSVIISGAILESNNIKLSDNTLLSGSNFFIETLEGNGGGG